MSLVGSDVTIPSYQNVERYRLSGSQRSAVLNNPVQYIRTPGAYRATPIAGTPVVPSAASTQAPLRLASGAGTGDLLTAGGTTRSATGLQSFQTQQRVASSPFAASNNPQPSLGGRLQEQANFSNALNTGSSGPDSLVNPGTVSPGTNDFSGPTSATKGDPAATAGGTEAGLTQESADSGEGGPREVTCSICGGQIMSNFTGRIFFYIQQFLQRFSAIVIPIGVILNYFRERGAIPVTTALTVCGACENKRTVKDPSDNSAQYAQAASIAQSVAPQIEQAEASMGTPSGNGGNLFEIHAGHVYKKIGLAMNTCPSYRVDRNCSYRNWGISTGDKSTTGPDGFKTGEANTAYSFRASRGARRNHVQGLNPPAVPGGTYTIESANSLNLVTGAQGFSLNTGGPVVMNGGITRITGPEISIGTQTGGLNLAGEVINMEAKSIEMAPSDGHVYTRGTMSCSGNMIVGGHGHMESASIVKLATVGKNDDTKTSSSSNVYGGPAFWGGPVYEGIYAALRELLAFVTVNTLHPVHIREVGPLSLRYPQSLVDNMLNIAYIQRPIELVPTGLCVSAPFLGSLFGNPIGVVFNFPHVHAMPDQPHSHGVRVPDIDFDAETAQQLRGIAASGAMGHAPLQKKNTSLLDLLIAIWQVISAVWIAAGKALLENNYVK